MKCEICGIEEGQGRLVRDHDHKTGFTRGTLCQQCNSRLGSYESLHARQAAGLRTRKRNHRFCAWVAQYEQQIKQYLNKSASGMLHKRHLEFVPIVLPAQGT
jgi:transcriptional regulator NrdR family protein